MRKILHVVPDDKFIDRFKEIDDSIDEVKSFYMIKVPSIDYVPKYVRSNLDFKIVWTRDDLRKFFFNFSDYDCIFFHSIDFFVYYLLKKIPSRMKIYWFYWGFEKYFLFNKKELYCSGTRAILKDIDIFQDAPIFKLRKFVKQTRDRFLMHLVFKRVDYCITWVKLDYIELNNLYRNLKYAHFNYYAMEQLNLQNEFYRTDGVVLGNSADPSNNHIDGLRFLIKNGYDFKVLIPFSYGGNLTYRNRIKEFIQVHCKSLDCCLLEDFVSISEYNEIVNSMGGFLFCHQRQQAAGNYISAFLMKKNVYYFTKTTLIRQLESEGFIIYPIEKFGTSDESDLNRNFNLAKSIFNLRNSYLQLKNIYNLN